MSLQGQWDLQTQVFDALRWALDPVLVTTAPERAARYVRIDGWNVVNPERYRNAESTNQMFFVHAFDAPAGGTKSLAWVKQTMARINNVLMGNAYLSRRGLTMEGGSTTFEPRADEGHDAHGLIRYRVQIGG